MKQKNACGWGKALRLSAVAVAGLCLLFAFLSMVQSRVAMERQRSNSETKLRLAAQRLAENAADADADWAIYDGFLAAKVDTVAWLPDTADAGEDLLEDAAAQWGLCTVYLTDSEGNVKTAVNGSASTLEAAGLGRLVAYAQGRDTHPYVTENGICHYLSVRADGSYVVGGIDSAAMIAAQDERFTAAYSLKDIKVGNTGFIVAVDTAKGTIAYAPDGLTIGKDAAAELGGALVPGASGYTTYGGETMYFENAEAHADKTDYLLIAMIPKAEITALSRPVIVTVMVISTLTVAALILYTVLLGRDEPAEAKYCRLSGKLCLDLTTGKRLRTVAAAALAALVIAALYANCLTNVSRQRIVSENKLAETAEVFARNEQRTEALKNTYAEEYGRRAQNIAKTLALAPELTDENTLKTFAEKVRVDEIRLFDERGKTVVTSGTYKDFTLSKNEEDQSYPFWQVVKGYRPVLVQQAMRNETDDALVQYIGAAREDAPGMVQIAVQPELLESRLKSTAVAHVLHNVAVENGGALYAIDPADGTFLFHPTEKQIGRDAGEYGFTPAAMKDDYIGWKRLNGVSSFVMTRLCGATLLAIAVPTAVMMGTVLPVAAVIGIAGLAVFALIVFTAMLTTTREEARAGGTPAADGGARFFTVTDSAGRTRKTVAAAERWDGVPVAFSELDAAGKLRRIFGWLVGGAALLLLLLTVTGATDRSPLISFILSKRWEKTPSLFSVTYVLISAVQILTVSGILRRIIRAITRMENSRTETIGRLVDSFLKYATAIGVVFYCLQFFGVDTATLLAGAGILTLIVGLGAQQLVADIMAGLFIVFEGEFRVGDIVTIDGWRGTVEEIGIRTTKIKSPGQDIKIVRNSAISGVINQTRRYSYAVADCGIEYGESLERVEAVLKNELPHIKEHLPAIVDGPFYKGVAELGDSAVVVRIVAQCAEKDRVQLQRDLNREIKLIFDRNNVGIPFPQIVVNTPTPRTQATADEKHAAASFVAEQKEKLAGHDVEPN
ncbi:MAG: mechanosensitive ion channel [Clostridia bacterium]|nr:mechanosensitive ion channel [Clostridia bacterium]